jgi:hypothetical protein
MDYKKEYKELVRSIKESAKAKGIKLKNEDMARKMGYNPNYFSTLTGGSGVVNKSHLEELKLHFSQDLSEIKSPFTPEDPLNFERATLLAHEKEIAMLKSMLYEVLGRERSYEECLDDIAKSRIKILADLRRSNG